MRYAAKIDENQTDIVKALRSIPGVKVALGHDDIIVGHRGANYWFEVKNPEKLFNADGMTFRKGAIRPSQIELRRSWTGHYEVVWSLDMILKRMGISK